MPAEPEHVARNRAAWNRWAPSYVAPGRAAWNSDEPFWGVWETPEAELGLLADLPPEADVVDLGCGTAYASAWLARRGARPVGVDVAEAQLDTARMFQAEFGLEFPLHRANAEEVPFDDESFDLALSEYGASIWCDPYRWVPEAARVLRPGGRLVFLVTGAMLMACTPDDGIEATEELVRDYFGMHRFDFAEEDFSEFHLPHGDWVRLLAANRLVLEDLVEVRPPADAISRFDFVSLDWARRWPSEEIWIARKST